MFARNFSLTSFTASLHGCLPRCVLPLALAMGLATAGSSALAQAGATCVPGGTVAETNACAVKDFQEADTALQIYYGDVMRILSAHERPTLRQDQSNWQRTSRQQCKRQSSGHESQPEWTRVYHACLIDQLKARRLALTHWLHHGEAPNAPATSAP